MISEIGENLYYFLGTIFSIEQCQLEKFIRKQDDYLVVNDLLEKALKVVWESYNFNRNPEIIVYMDVDYVADTMNIRDVVP